MAKSKKRKVGDVGEGVVCRYLEGHEFTVLEQNYWKPWGEIDIVAEKDEVLHFVEVKSVSREMSSGFGSVRPEENMHGNKVKRLNRAIQTYLLERKVGERVAWQIDLACAYLDFSTRRAKVELLENIVL